MILRRFVKKTFIFLALIVILVGGVNKNILGFSSTPMWDGATGTGAVVKSDDNSVVLEKEKVTFYANEFPREDYDLQKDYLAYSGKVETEYTLYNPTDKVQSIQFLLPVETANGYAGNSYGANMGVYDNSSLYGMSMDGKEYEPIVRYAYKGESMYEAKDTATNMLQSYIGYGVFTSDALVTKYEYVADEVPNGCAKAYISMLSDKKRRIVFEEDYEVSYDEGNLIIEKEVTQGEAYTMYCIGEPLPEDCQWNSVGYVYGNQIVEANIVLKGAETMTLKDYILSYYDERMSEIDISSMDWYNAVMVKTFYNKLHNDVFAKIECEIAEELEIWYEYRVEIQPGEQLVCSVNVPIYPTTNGGYEPYVYEYEYSLLTETSNIEPQIIEMVIDTPYYLISSNIESVEKTGSGFSGLMDEVGEETIKFSLCTKNDPYGGEHNGLLLGVLFYTFYGALLFAEYLQKMIIVKGFAMVVTIVALAVVFFIIIICKKKK